VSAFAISAGLHQRTLDLPIDSEEREREREKGSSREVGRASDRRSERRISSFAKVRVHIFRDELVRVSTWPSKAGTRKRFSGMYDPVTIRDRA